MNIQQDETLRISLIQYNIAWENKEANLSYIENIISSLALKTDVAILPEMCTTGFTMNSQSLAELNNGKTINLIKKWAIEYDIAICGSFISKDEDENKYYNRGFFISSDKELYYDKRHLFRMGNESLYFSEGKKRLVFEHKGFNICLLICYDLRFPVWSRNVDKEYDLLIYVANWPESRIKVWDTLLTARAIENMSYVCGVNRTGIDGNKLVYNGKSKVVNAKGDEILSTSPNVASVETISISKTELEKFREKFPVWKDADKFELKNKSDI